MRVTIVPVDNMIYLDNFNATVDCSSLDPSIHAVQWNGNIGEIEYKNVVTGKKTRNEEITDISPYSDLIALAQQQEQELSAVANEMSEFERLLAEGSATIPDNQTFNA